MSIIESIVRPFQTPLLISTERIAVLTTIVPPATAIISWGAAGTVAAPTQDPADATTPGEGFTIVDCNDHVTESKRVTEKVRIQNPDDPSQYVIVERIKTITFSSVAQAGGSYTDVSGFVHDPAFGSNPVSNPCDHTYALKPPS